MFSKRLQIGKITQWPSVDDISGKDEIPSALRRVTYEMTRKGASTWIFTDGKRQRWDYISPTYRLSPMQRLVRLIVWHPDNGPLIADARGKRIGRRYEYLTERTDYAVTLMDQAKHSKYPARPYYEGMVWKPSLLIFDDVDRWVGKSDMKIYLYRWVSALAARLDFAVLSIDYGDRHARNELEKA